MSGPEPLSAEWCAHHFDHQAPELSADLYATLARMRAEQPVAHTDAHGGHWVVTGYEPVLEVAQDWRTYSSAQGVSIHASKGVVPAIPEHVDPPIHREYKRLINAWFTPAVVAGYERRTREIVTALLDEVIEAGACDVVADLARPFPGLAFFELVLHAPPEEVATINALSTAASQPGNPDARASWEQMFAWIVALVERRRREPPLGDVVDAVLAGEVEGRPLTDDEVIGIVQLLILGGLDTTAGALAQFVIRFAEQPEIPALLREQPELVPAAVEELLRLDPPFVAIARTATAATELGGEHIEAGEKVLLYWASANRDEQEFSGPADFDLERSSNRHLAFGAGPHRCAGSNLARLNLRVAVEEITQRLHDLRLADDADPVEFHTVLTRTPRRVPITFTPGPRLA